MSCDESQAEACEKFKVLQAGGIRFNVRQQPETHEFLKQLSPMKRLAKVEEVADLKDSLKSRGVIPATLVVRDRQCG